MEQFIEVYIIVRETGTKYTYKREYFTGKKNKWSNDVTNAHHFVLRKHAKAKTQDLLKFKYETKILSYGFHIDKP